ncbi:MAG: hypothetical protein LQ338_008175, partial [Usnochroma carphineum]
MFFSLVAFFIFQLFYLATATPVGPPGQNADGTILLPNPADGNLSSVHAPLILPNNTANNDPDPTTTLGAGHVGRPRMAKIYPQLAVGKYHIRFHNYGQDIDRQEGASVLARAAHEVQDWIAHTRKQSYTPVESEHTWRSEKVELSIRPRQDGYTLGDLK